MTRYKTIQLSVETYDRLYRMKVDLEKTVGRAVSLEDVLRILLLTRPLEQTIEDLMLE